MRLNKVTVGKVMPAPALTTREKVEIVLAHTKSGKSCGTDGAPYEFWCAALQSDSAEQHLIEFLNDVLFGNQDFHRHGCCLSFRR